MELLKLLSTNEIVAQVLGFLLLLFLLRAFAWKKMLKLLDDRKEKIALEFKNIADARLEIAKIKAEYEEKLSKIEEIANLKIQEAIQEGKKRVEELRKKAYEESQDIIDNARAGIKDELSQAKEELRTTIIELTISAAESVIQERLTEEQDRRLIKEFLEKLDALDER